MSKTLDRMTKSELINVIALRDALIAQQNSVITKQDHLIAVQQGKIITLESRNAELYRSNVMPQHQPAVSPLAGMSAKSQRYCEAHGVRSVDLETLRRWEG